LAAREVTREELRKSPSKKPKEKEQNKKVFFHSILRRNFSILSCIIRGYFYVILATIRFKTWNPPGRVPILLALTEREKPKVCFRT